MDTLNAFETLAQKVELILEKYETVVKDKEAIEQRMSNAKSSRVYEHMYTPYSFGSHIFCESLGRYGLPFYYNNIDNFTFSSIIHNCSQA